LFVIVDAEDRSFWLHSCFRNGEPAEPQARQGKSENFLDREFRAR
jgi:hypothetical protein